jgi:hypothetical protein
MTGFFTTLAGVGYGASQARSARGRRVMGELDVALGQAPNAVTPDARRALLAQAKRGEQHLRMLLATLSFLAETEHVPRIDLALVERAASLQPVQVADGPDRSAPTRGMAVAVVLGVTAGTALVLAGFHASRQPANQQADAVISPPHMTTPATAPVIATIVPGPAVKHDQMQAQSQATLVPTPRPAPRHAVLHLRFYMADPASPPYARFVAQRLQRIGFSVDAKADFTDWPPRMPSVHYFYEQDRALATCVAAAADLSPARITRLAGGRRWRNHPPGTIELYLP